MSNRRRALWSLPWVLALVGLAVPMVGSGFVGWPFVVGWLVLMLVTWWVRPLGGADRTARLAVGVFTVALLALLGTLGGLFLIPAVLVWLALVAAEPSQALPGVGRLRSRWVRGLVLWTMALLVVAVLVAVQAMVSLADAQQACFFGYPSIPCPAGDDPRVAQLTVAFFGIPLAWLVGLGLAALAWAVRRRGGDHPR